MSSQRSKMQNFVLGLAISLALAFHGIKRKSLDKSGAVAASAVGITLFTANPAMGFLLIFFYLCGSRISKWKEDLKKRQEDVVKSARDYKQVVAASLPILLSAFLFEMYHPYFASIMALTSMSCNLGDTFASEIGSVSSSKPVLLTTLKTVPPGTNGGISLVGTISSYIGGCVIGCAYMIFQYFYPTSLERLSVSQALIFGGGAGLVGSFIDSFLGATLQVTYFDPSKKKIAAKGKYIAGLPFLSNEAVNLVSSLATGILFALLLSSVKSPIP